jgi:predicted enzyme related to lactoylglutathione lyase
MGRVVHFEIHAGDPDLAERFYTEVFGWAVRRWEGPVDYRLVTTGPDDRPGINGAIVERRGEVGGQAVNAYVCTVEVESIEATEDVVRAAGGEQITERAEVPGVGHVSYFKDPEGNTFGAIQPAGSA